MKTIRLLFILGLSNFVLVFSTLAAGKTFSPAEPTSTASEVVAKVSPTIATPTPIIRIIKRIVTITPKAQNPAPQTNPPESQATQPNTVSEPQNQTSSVPAATPTTDPLVGKCIITIDGVRYDVTVYRNIHGGGDVFACGSDMSATFHNQHPTSFLGKIDKYRI